MADAKHTPGPWEINSHAGPTDIAAVEPFRDIGVAFTNGSSDLAEGIANARLIAASPTLLEALKEAHAALKAYENAHDQDAGSWSLGGLHEAEERGCLAVLNSEAAIAKAEGEV